MPTWRPGAILCRGAIGPPPEARKSPPRGVSSRCSGRYRRDSQMPFFDIPAVEPRTLAPGITIRTAWGERIMLSFLDFEKEGATVPPHRHPHEQMGMGLEGEFRLIIGDDERIIRAGDAY